MKHYRLGRVIAAALALAVLLGACAAPAPRERPAVEAPGAEQIERARQLAEDGRTLAAVRAYRELADVADAAGRQRYRLRIVELLFAGGYPELAVQWHQRLEREPVPAELVTRKRVADAQVAVIRRQGVEALRVLPTVRPDLDRDLRARMLAIRADAYRLTGQPGRAILSRIQREELLTERSVIEENHEAIWSLLQSIPTDHLKRLAALDDAPVLRGWTELARAVRSAQRGARPVPEALSAWARDFADHPASVRFIESLRERVIAELNYPDRIALLLPLSGQLAAPAQAIRDGVLAAYYDQPDYVKRPEIVVYDTGSDGMAPARAYDRAVAEGAGFVIGPLAKSAVSRIAQRAELEVPVLSLNYLPRDTDATPPGLYQFGLLPEDEASQAAEAAVQNNHFNALALVPAGDWGRRMLEAFEARFAELGGVVVEASQYNSRATDYGRPIQALLNLDGSKARRRTLQSVIGRNVRFEPRRRQDVEVIFVAAMPKQARLIEPQLEFHRASEIPAYATSHAFTGTADPDADWDMNGLYFTEIPWILENLDNPAGLYRPIAEYWPGPHERFPRLYALGIDALSLLPHLDRLSRRGDSALAGRTGRLTLDSRLRVHRQLRWAHFVEGRPVPIAAPESSRTLLEGEEVGADVRERAEGS